MRNAKNSQSICLYSSHVVTTIFRIRNAGNDKCDKCIDLKGDYVEK
ncbi:hypothetical protein ALC60_04903 [Trachymyrmex zeteki]|uniref:Uncharacterized protein n=1 Tax=Mycetomoellerius zeteki TaxID=64791 RepID=A0A151X720_9HYME|nr:hypothetical protein ALC60_04903 [Trachymyrmex zeteki]